jgi:hypothetical protein
MTPRLLTDWTKEQLTQLLVNGVFEPESFDFKEFRIAKKTEPEKQDIRKDCCAFANSFGGFLIYGVGDDRRLPAKDRVIGIDKNFDFPREFGAFPKECKPSISWEFLNPAIDLGNGQVIHVVFVPRSWRGPHCIQADKPQEGFVFPKRTNKGTEYMSYEEVRMTFLGYYEKRLKLQLLQAELQNILADARALLVAPQLAAQQISTASFRLEVMESILVDTFTILVDQNKLLKSLTAIRTTAKHVNNKLAMFYPTAGLPLTNHEQRCREHNDWLRANIPPILQSAEEAFQELQRFLASA